MRINIITIFPKTVESILQMGIFNIARKKGKADYRVVDLRDFSDDLHRTVDDAPYGGGPGMILMAEPLYNAVRSLKTAEKSPVILMSPAGRVFNQQKALKLVSEKEITFICGRYKGVDERLSDIAVTEQISLGDFVLSGGELAAAACIEAVVRLQENVLGNMESAQTDSFAAGRDNLLDCAYYTRPEEFMGLRVPDVLLSGHHAEIAKWRMESSIERTKKFRPDLLEREKD